MRVPLPLTSLLLIVVLVATPASAQTVSALVDLDSFRWGPIDIPDVIETDGDDATVEYLIRALDTGLYRVVANRDGRLCAGPWFPPMVAVEDRVTALPYGPVTVALRTVNTRTQMWARSYNGPMSVITLQTPVCE